MSALRIEWNNNSRLSVHTWRFIFLGPLNLWFCRIICAKAVVNVFVSLSMFSDGFSEREIVGSELSEVHAIVSRGDGAERILSSVRNS